MKRFYGTDLWTWSNLVVFDDESEFNDWLDDFSELELGDEHIELTQEEVQRLVRDGIVDDGTRIVQSEDDIKNRPLTFWDRMKLASYFVCRNMFEEELMLEIGCSTELLAEELVNLKWGAVLNWDGEVGRSLMDEDLFEATLMDRRNCFDIDELSRDLIREYIGITGFDFSVESYSKPMFPNYAMSADPEEKLSRVLNKAAKEIGIGYPVGSSSLKKTFVKWFSMAKLDFFEDINGELEVIV